MLPTVVLPTGNAVEHHVLKFSQGLLSYSHIHISTHTHTYAHVCAQGIVDNPLANIDLVNTMGVKYIPDTEDFLEEIGHLGTPSKLKRLPKEVCGCVRGGEGGAVDGLCHAPELKQPSKRPNGERGKM